ncbi:hypothetical protein ACLOJK_004709 [Asimina triloba]
MGLPLVSSLIWVCHQIHRCRSRMGEAGRMLPCVMWVLHHDGVWGFLLAAVDLKKLRICPWFAHADHDRVFLPAARFHDIAIRSECFLLLLGCRPWLGRDRWWMPSSPLARCCRSGSTAVAAMPDLAEEDEAGCCCPLSLAYRRRSPAIVGLLCSDLLQQMGCLINDVAVWDGLLVAVMMDLCSSLRDRFSGRL